MAADAASRPLFDAAAEVNGGPTEFIALLLRRARLPFQDVYNESCHVIEAIADMVWGPVLLVGVVGFREWMFDRNESVSALREWRYAIAQRIGRESAGIEGELMNDINCYLAQGAHFSKTHQMPSIANQAI